MEATATITYGVCMDGALADDDSEFKDGAEALAKATDLKRENPDDLVTICLWTE